MPIETLEVRLEKLERSARRFRFALVGLAIGVIVCAVICSVLVVQAAATRTVQVEVINHENHKAHTKRLTL